MKIDDLSIPKNDISRIASKVLKAKEEPSGEGDTYIGTEICVQGKELDERLSSELLIKIEFKRAPLSKSLRVTRFWGNRVLIDINGMTDDGKRKSRNDLLALIVSGIEEYLTLRSNTPYGHVDVDQAT